MTPFQDGPQARRHIEAVADELFTDERDPRLLAILAYAVPVERGSTVVDGLTHLAGQQAAGPQEERFLHPCPRTALRIVLEQFWHTLDEWLRKADLEESIREDTRAKPTA